MYFTDNPIKDAFRHDEEMETWLEKRPKCIFCKEHIQTEKSLELPEGRVCEDCEIEFASDIVAMIREDYISEVENE